MYLKLHSKETGLSTTYKVTLTYPLLYSVLLRVKKKAWAFSISSGICNRVEKELKAMGYRCFDSHDSMVVQRLMRSWDEYSGDIAFPVNTSKRLSGYEEFHSTKFKFNPFTKYGKARRRLLDHMIKECERIIAKENQQWTSS